MKELLKKKVVTIPIAIILYFILLVLATKVTGALTLIASIGGGAYLFIKNDKFKSKNKFIKGLTVIGLIFAMLFGIGALNYDPVEAQRIKVAQEKSKEEKRLQEEKIKKDAEEKAKLEAEQKNKDEEEKNKEVQTSATVQGDLKIHFINVGQADSILLQQGGQAMLIDAGNNADDKTVKTYLDSVGVKELNTVIGTHMHEDHIGGMAYIINNLKVGKIYIPKQTSTTKTFENLVTATKNKGLQFTAPTVGTVFNIGQAKCTIIAPKQEKYEDINDSSIVIKVEYGDTSFLLTGDAEAVSEMEMFNAGVNLKANVLKIGHHGSMSSTCANFLSAVNPKYAVISVGKNNDYGHPNQGTMDRLKDAGVQVFRTDENGTIVATSNGKDIIFNCNPASYTGKESAPKKEESTSSNSNSNNSSSNNSNTSTSSGNTGNSNNKSVTTNEPAKGERTVYWTSGGNSYHYSSGCRSLARSKNIQEGPSSSCPKSDPCNNCVK